MRFNIKRDQFFKGLKVAGYAIGGKSVNQVLLYYKLDLNETGLEITASNGNLSIFTKIPTTIDGNEIIRSFSLGAILVSAAELSGLVNKLDGDDVSFEVLDDVVAAVSSGGKSDYKLNCLNAQEYPDVPFEKLNSGFSVLGADLSRMVEQTAFAALAKDGRPILTAINFKAEAGILTATATDGARLSKKEMQIDSDARFSVNISAKVIADICRLFDPGDTIEVSASPDRMVFEFGNTRVFARLIAGDYPVSSKIIPENFMSSVTVDSNELLKALDRATTLLVDNKVVKLSMSEEDVEISLREEQTVSGVEKIFMASYEGEPLEINFNATYLIDALKSIGSEDAMISFTGEMKPFVVKNPKDDSLIQLITPIRTR